jgi:hypothetical protein
LPHWAQKKTTTYDIGNLGPILGQTYKSDGVKSINETHFW